MKTDARVNSDAAARTMFIFEIASYPASALSPSVAPVRCTTGRGGYLTDFDDRSTGTEDSERTDAELIDATRAGDRDAFGALWRRHIEAARRVAGAVTRRFDADDLTSEAFAKVYRAIRAGNGPDEALMPYLAATIRNTAATWGTRSREIAVEDPTAYVDTQDMVQPAVERDSVLSTAFLSLPERWREVLWYSEVEGYTAAEIGRALGLSANAAAALTYRAREGLRTAWVQAHLETIDSDAECRFVTKNLGAYARGSVSAATRQRIERHLERCPSCRALAGDAATVSRRLRALVVVGFGTAAAGVALPLAQPAPAVAVAGVAAAHSHRSARTLAQSGVAVVATLAAAVVATALLHPQTPVDPAPTATPYALLAPSPEAAPRATKAPAGRPSPASQPRQTTPPSPVPAIPATPAITSPSPSPSPTPTPTPTPSPRPPQAATLTVDPLAQPYPFHPAFTGSATAGATVSMSSPAGTRSAVADASGRWSLPAEIALPVGTSVLEFTARAPGRASVAVQVAFELAGLEVCACQSRRQGTESLTVDITGLPGRSVQIELSGIRSEVVLSQDGTATLVLPAPPGHRHSLLGRYVDGTHEGRWFPASRCPTSDSS
jgi:RNA polymerase sigma factor (sigma-70 family)